LTDDKRVVIVDDEVIIAEYLKDLCTNCGALVVGVEHEPDGAEEKILSEHPDYVLMDVRLGAKRDGIDVAATVHEKMPDLKIVFVTGSTEQATLDRIEQVHPHKVLIKPIFPNDLARVIGPCS